MDQIILLFDEVENITHIGCFTPPAGSLKMPGPRCPKENTPPTANQGVSYCTKLFDLEKEYAEQQLTFEKRKQQRLKRSKPVLDPMLAWAGIRNAAPKPKLEVDRTYLKNQREPLVNLLADIRIELNNNQAERNIKPLVMSRKKFLFTNTPLSTQSSAIIFRRIETAKENGPEPCRCLPFVLREAPRFSTKVRTGQQS